MSLQNAITCSATLVYKESLKLVTASVQRVLQVLGLMMSNPFTFDRKPRKLCFCFLMRPTILSVGAYDLVHLIRGLVYDTNRFTCIVILENCREVTLSRASQDYQPVEIILILLVLVVG